MYGSFDTGALTRERVGCKHGFLLVGRHADMTILELERGAMILHDSIWSGHRRCPGQAVMQVLAIFQLCTSCVKTHPVTTNLFPLNLLTGDGKLSSQALEGTFVEFCESLVDFCLVALFELCDFADGIAGVGDRDGL
jgi:hypothetical protein